MANICGVVGKVSLNKTLDYIEDDAVAKVLSDPALEGSYLPENIIKGTYVGLWTAIICRRNVLASL